jgi:hypothetical protein
MYLIENSYFSLCPKCGGKFTCNKDDYLAYLCTLDDPVGPAARDTEIAAMERGRATALAERTRKCAEAVEGYVITNLHPQYSGDLIPTYWAKDAIRLLFPEAFVGEEKL